MDSRKRMGKDKDGVIFPVAPNLSEMSDSYLDFIEEIKKEIQNQRISVVLNANSSMICLYWNIGKTLLQKQEEEGWGAKVIDRMAKDLKDAFPDTSGFSPRNIKYMRKFAECWPDFEIVQQVVAQIPWRTNRMLLDKLDTEEERIWYAHKTIENGWSSTILDLQIQSKLIERTGKSVNNFPVALPPSDSDMANQIFKDPYLFDFLGTDMPRREVEIERKLTEHKVEFVHVFKLSRFGRNAADVLSSLQRMQDFGVNLICVEDGIDSSKDSGKLMISVLSAVAEIEHENILVQTMEGRRQKAREGKWNGGFAPYGYKLVDEH